MSLESSWPVVEPELDVFRTPSKGAAVSARFLVMLDREGAEVLLLETESAVVEEWYRVMVRESPPMPATVGTHPLFVARLVLREPAVGVCALGRAGRSSRPMDGTGLLSG